MKHNTAHSMISEMNRLAKASVKLKDSLAVRDIDLKHVENELNFIERRLIALFQFVDRAKTE